MQVAQSFDEYRPASNGQLFKHSILERSNWELIRLRLVFNDYLSELSVQVYQSAFIVQSLRSSLS